MYKIQSLYEMIIVGAGPAGISLGSEAVHAGIDVKKILILEKANNHSWSIRRYYPEEKLVTANYKGVDAVCKGTLCLLDSSKEETLTYLDQVIEDNKLYVRYNHSVHEIKKLRSGYYVVRANHDEFVTKTIAIAIGIMGKPNKPSYSIPRECLKQVLYDVTSIPLVQKKVLVVGGGDSACEYAQYLSEKNQVIFSYRQKQITRMNDINLKSFNAMTSQGKISALLGSDIEKVEAHNGQVQVFLKTGQGPIVVDYIIYALGGTSPKNFLINSGIKMSKEGPELSEFFETSQEGIFLLGDLSAGKTGGSINLAFNSAHDAMQEFCRSYLDCRI